MKQFKVYFSLYGKKMKTVVFADNKESAKQSVKNMIVFDKINEEKISNPITDFIKGFGKK
jgi:hypothetical protein